MSQVNNFDDQDEQVTQNDPTDSQQDISQLEQQIADLTAALQRERADAENLRRRHAQQMGQLEKTATGDVVGQLLPVIDNVERALSHIPANLQGDDFVKGVQGVAKQFASALQRLGVKRILTVGQPFDPHLHEAVSTEEGDDGEEVVTEELQAGYQLGDQVIRHAMVKVRT